MRRRWRLASALFLASAYCVASAAPAAAHASFESASPAPGTGLPQAPGAVAMRFSEPLNRRLSRIEVLDRSGRDVGVGPTQAVERDPFAMRRELGLLRPGQFTVRWLTVSALDGHSLQGSYHFAVGTDADPGQSVRTSPIDSEGGLGLVGRWVALVGIALWVGVVALGGVVRGELGRDRVARIGRLAPALAAGGIAATVLSQALVVTGGVGGFTRVLASGPSAHWRTVELAAALVGVAPGGRWRWAAAPLAALAVLAEAASGHAASSSTPTLATASFAVHLSAVGVWVFAIAAAVLAPATRRTLRRLSPYAIGAAVAVAATGALNAVIGVGSVGALTRTGYGRAVLVKVAALALMAGLGLTHNRLRRGAVADTVVRRPALLELVAAAVALATASALVGFPNPPREVEAAAAAAGPDALLTHLGSAPALSMATASRPFVVGLTVVPPSPGPVELRVQVLGAEAGDGLGNARISLHGPAGDTTSDLRSCGFGCFAGHGRIDSPGQWSLLVSIDSTRQPIRARFDAPLPTPDGRPLLQRVLSSQEQLRSASMREELRGTEGGPGEVADYRFSAPDAFEISVGGRDQIVIGPHSYDKADATSPWVASPWPGPPYTWPKGYFRDFWHEPAAVRILGTAPLDGADMTVLAFVRPDLPAWFRIWVDADGIVHREEMRAEGHLMDHSYSAINATPPLSPPSTTRPSP